MLLKRGQEVFIKKMCIKILYQENFDENKISSKKKSNSLRIKKLQQCIEFDLSTLFYFCCSKLSIFQKKFIKNKENIKIYESFPTKLIHISMLFIIQSVYPFRNILKCFSLNLSKFFFYMKNFIHHYAIVIDEWKINSLIKLLNKQNVLIKYRETSFVNDIQQKIRLIHYYDEKTLCFLIKTHDRKIQSNWELQKKLISYSNSWIKYILNDYFYKGKIGEIYLVLASLQLFKPLLCNELYTNYIKLKFQVKKILIQEMNLKLKNRIIQLNKLKFQYQILIFSWLKSCKRLKLNNKKKIDEDLQYERIQIKMLKLTINNRKYLIRKTNFYQYK